MISPGAKASLLWCAACKVSFPLHARPNADFAWLRRRLIHYVNMDGRVNVFYSSPAEYVEAKASYADVAWPVKTDDFFPYADCPHCYWTGAGSVRLPAPLLAQTLQVSLIQVSCSNSYRCRCGVLQCLAHGELES
jgi:hypothetical protein